MCISAMLVVALGVVTEDAITGADIAVLRAQKAASGWTFGVGETSGTERPLRELCGLKAPKDWRAGARIRGFAAKADLPAAFDWRAADGCTPIKNQGGCGSCWAFATAGAFECNIKIRDGAVVSLSEQWLVSCNQAEEVPHVLGGAWGCGGGWWAHDYYSGAATDPCRGSGAVLTSDFPYSATDLPCDCPYPHRYGIDTWAYIGGEESPPGPDAIKQAIYTYGPVCACVYVNDAFRAYKEGVFNASETAEPNHAILLVGWDDTQGTSGAWILRNSWGTRWGYEGYMYIEYGCSEVGFAANYIDYAGDGLGIPPVIVEQPQDASEPLGWYCTFRVRATGAGDMHYAWRHDGAPVGGNSPTLHIPTITAADAGTYMCTVSDARGATDSDAAELVIDTAAKLPAAGGVLMQAVACVSCMVVGAWLMLKLRFVRVGLWNRRHDEV